jgi:hypothetical protein
MVRDISQELRDKSSGFWKEKRRTKYVFTTASEFLTDPEITAGFGPKISIQAEPKPFFVTTYP